MGERILAVGAAGKAAGLVIPALARRGAQVRGLVRRLAGISSTTYNQPE